MMIGMNFLFGPGANAEEYLDRPLSNFDVGGIPRDKWSSGLFACYKNWAPSCVMSFFCPCIMWAQIVVRAQIPLLIAVKNSMSSCRKHSGYSFFVNSFLFFIALSLIFIIGGSFLQKSFGRGILLALFFIVFLFLMFVFGHIRTAFKMKYNIPSALPRGSEFWDCALDACVATFCNPCASAQMARHVFQYDRWNPPLSSFYVSDPYGLPPLEVEPVRPIIADRAGILWTEDVPHPNSRRQTGAAHREEEENSRNIPPVQAYATTSSNNNNNGSIRNGVYRPDGSHV